jgi:uroporphyrinogen decarboxylase
MPKETMTPRERWLAVLQRKKPDRIPMDYWTTSEAQGKLMEHLGVSTTEARCERLHIDNKVGVGPRYVGPAVPAGSDVFGCRYKDTAYGTGIYSECVHNPLAAFTSVAQIEKGYRWPSPDWYDYAQIPADIRGQDRHPIQGGGSEPFLTYKNLRGDVQAFIDLVENPEIVHYCLDKLFGLAYENTRRIYEAIPGKVVISYVAEDMGGQEDLMISPDQARTFLLPRMKRVMDLVHQAGAYVFHHNDGAVRKIIPDMIALGSDVLNPIQWRCRGMEREGLKRDFGDRLVFHGGVDNQQTLPFGTAEEVRREVADNIRILGRGGGYIIAPCHNIQAVSPAENVTALYEAGYEHGWSTP